MKKNDKTIKMCCGAIGLGLMAFVVALAGCSPKTDSDIHTADGVYYPSTTEDEIEWIVQNNIYEGCTIERLCDDLQSCRTIFSVDDSQIQSVIQKKLDDNPTIVKSEKRIIELGDLLKIKYSMTDQSTGEELFSTSQATAQCGGKIYHHRAVFESLEGHGIGETYTIDNCTDRAFPNHRIKCTITPLYIYTLEEAILDDSFIKQYTQFMTVQEWKTSLYEELYTINRDVAWQKSLDKLIKNSTFRLNQELIVSKASQIAANDLINARAIGIELEQYVRGTYGISYDEYLVLQFNNCEKAIKEYLLVMAVAEVLDLTLAEYDLDEYAQKTLSKPVAFLTEEEYSILRYSLIREKVIQYFVQSEY